MLKQRHDHMPKENVRAATLRRALAHYETKLALLDEHLQFWTERKLNRAAKGIR